MGDCLRITKDKRQRSSSSLTGVAAEARRSDRKLDVRASIPEIDDQFTLAEARCDDLQDKLHIVKGLKRRRKLKKRSMTRVSETPPLETMPLVSVRTQPKNRVAMQAARLRRLQLPLPTRGYLDPATVEQHRMIEKVQQLHSQFYEPQPQKESVKKQASADPAPLLRQKSRRVFAHGDSSRQLPPKFKQCSSLEVACGDDDTGALSETETRNENFSINVNKKPLLNNKPLAFRRRHVPKDIPVKEVANSHAALADSQRPWRAGMAPLNRRVPAHSQLQTDIAMPKEERPIVELFNKDRGMSPMSCQKQDPGMNIHKKVREVQRQEEPEDSRDDEVIHHTKEKTHAPCRVRYRSRRYELPTVASQMKQSSQRYHYSTSNSSHLPFVVTKSTAPSHNIAVNIQQVLNGLKVQQPLSGIPLTIAHHMGLGYVPFSDSKMVQQPSLDPREINVIRVGRRLVRLPTYKYMSYNRLLSLYREGDGVVSRFLRALGRPHCFYTSMFNLTSREECDGATSKGRAGNQEAKQSLAEYASLYREYERLDKSLKEGCGDAALVRRRDEMARELAAREEHIRWVVQECEPRAEAAQLPLRTSASTAEQSCRFSSLKLHLGDAAQ